VQQLIQIVRDLDASLDRDEVERRRGLVDDE
jgi:hypothetical protein